MHEGRLNAACWAKTSSPKVEREYMERIGRLQTAHTNVRLQLPFQKILLFTGKLLRLCVYSFDYMQQAKLTKSPTKETTYIAGSMPAAPDYAVVQKSYSSINVAAVSRN